jgi:hypothetical protein
LDLRNPGNTLELRLIIRNASGLPIKFVIEKYDVIIEGQIVKCNLNGAVIARDGIMTISPGHGFTKTQYSSFKSRFRGTIEYILVYGDPDGHLSRRSYKLVSIDFFKKGAALNNNWVIVNESEEPA